MVAYTILTVMEKIFKKLNKKFLAGFIPLSAISLYFSGVKPAVIFSIALGLVYIAWQILRDE